MKKIFTVIRSISRIPIVVLLTTSISIAQVNTKALVPAAPRIGANSFIVIDADSGAVLAAENADKTVHPASLTKMMTAYIGAIEIALGNINRNDKVLISEKAWKMSGSTMFVEVGEQMPVQELLKGIIIVSGNDASVALAEYIAGSEDSFTQLMNNIAKKLGMINTHFMNASGWPVNNHYSTARDLAILSKHILEDYPEDYALYAQKYYQYGVNKQTGLPLHHQANRNRLLWSNPDVDGLKTGYTESSGFSLAVTAKRDGRRLIIIILGAKNEKQRTEEAQKLLTYGFRFFENIDLKKEDIAFQKIPVWKGKSNTVSIDINKDLIVTVPRGTSKDLKLFFDIQSIIEAPIEIGEQLGTLKVMLNNEELVKNIPLLAQQSIDRGDFFKRIWDTIQLFISRLFK